MRKRRLRSEIEKPAYKNKGDGYRTSQPTAYGIKLSFMICVDFSCIKLYTFRSTEIFIKSEMIYLSNDIRDKLFILTNSFRQDYKKVLFPVSIYIVNWSWISLPCPKVLFSTLMTQSESPMIKYISSNTFSRYPCTNRSECLMSGKSTSKLISPNNNNTFKLLWKDSPSMPLSRPVTLKRLYKSSRPAHATTWQKEAFLWRSKSLNNFNKDNLRRK